jgi:hypothetical protein
VVTPVLFKVGKKGDRQRLHRLPALEQHRLHVQARTAISAFSGRRRRGGYYQQAQSFDAHRAYIDALDSKTRRL